MAVGQRLGAVVVPPAGAVAGGAVVLVGAVLGGERPAVVVGQAVTHRAAALELPHVEDEVLSCSVDIEHVVFGHADRAHPVVHRDLQNCVA